MDGEYLNQNTAHSLKCGWWWCALVTFGRCWILCSSWMSNRVGLHLWQDVAHADCVRRPPAVCWDRINIHKWLYTLMHGSFHVMYSTAAQGPPSQNWKCYRSDWLPPSTTPSPPLPHLPPHLPKVTSLPVSWSELWVTFPYASCSKEQIMPNSLA